MLSASTTNSSPPKRATTSFGRTAAPSRAAIADEELVAGVMARRVVDLLEVVEVDEHDAKAGAGERRPLARVVQPVEEVRARRERRQRVVVRAVDRARPPSACARRCPRASPSGGVLRPSRRGRAPARAGTSGASRRGDGAAARARSGRCDPRSTAAADAGIRSSQSIVPASVPGRRPSACSAAGLASRTLPSSSSVSNPIVAASNTDRYCRSLAASASSARLRVADVDHHALPVEDAGRVVASDCRVLAHPNDAPVLVRSSGTRHRAPRGSRARCRVRGGASARGRRGAAPRARARPRSATPRARSPEAPRSGG